MILLNSFDIHQDFWKTNPEASVLFNEEYESKVSSPHMWAHALLTHPDSKFFNESPSVRRTLIIEDYLKDPSFQFSPELIQKFQRYTLSKPQRLLVNWEQKLHQRDEFIASLDYSAETFDLLDKMIDKTPKLWQQYFSILEQIEKDKSSKVEGDIEESLTEKGLI